MASEFKKIKINPQELLVFNKVVKSYCNKTWNVTVGQKLQKKQ